MEVNNFLLFAFASLMLNITPGSDMLYVIARSTGQGIFAGIISSIGIMAGCFVHVLAAVFGLSAILASSALAFSIIKYLGAAYLVYLGLKSFYIRQDPLTVQTNAETYSGKKIFWQGVVTNALNPKVALFFLAFLPQFVKPSDPEAPYYFLLLGSWFNISGTLVNVAVAFAFGKMGTMLAKKQWFYKWQQKVTGIVLILLGLKIALSRT